MIDVIINITLLAFLAITAVAIVRMTNLFAIIMLFGIFSFLTAGLFVVMDAVDVAFTEAAVGAGISTVLMIATLALTKDQREKRPSSHRPWLPLAVVTVTGAALVYGTLDIPAFGDPNAPAQMHVAPYYLDRSMPETGVPQRGDISISKLSRIRYIGRGGRCFYCRNCGVVIDWRQTSKIKCREERKRRK